MVTEIHTYWNPAKWGLLYYFRASRYWLLYNCHTEMIKHFKEGNTDFILPTCFFPLYKTAGRGHRESYYLIIQLRIQPTCLLSSPQWTCSFRIIPSSSQSSSKDISCLHEKHFHPLPAPGRKWKENAHASQQDVGLCTWVLPHVSDVTCSHNQAQI